MEKNAYVHFVDERDFKEVSVVGKRKSKKNRAVGFILTAASAESSSEDEEVEGDVCFDLCLGLPDVVQMAFGPGLHGFRHRVQHVHGLVDPDGMVAALPRRHRNVPRSWC